MADERTPAGETVLVVEDDEALRAVTERIFARNGYQVITAGTGREAVELRAGTTRRSTSWSPTWSCRRCRARSWPSRSGRSSRASRCSTCPAYAQPGLGIEDRLDPGAALVEKPFSEATLLAKAAQVLNHLASPTRPRSALQDPRRS